MMGPFRVPVRVFSLADPAVGRELEMLVDTGATQSIVPREVLEALRVPVDCRQKFHLGNGEPIDRDVGWVGFRCQGRNAYTLAVSGDSRNATALGALTLQELGLEVDPQERTRKPAVAWLLAV